MNHNTAADIQAEMRKLPSVDALLQQADVAALLDRYGREGVTVAIRAGLEEARADIRQGRPVPQPAALVERVARHLAARYAPSLRPVINATGVIVHTNLGRAPLSAAAREAIVRLTTGYNSLEYDVEKGQRGSRHTHARRLLAELCGAEDALVVNNNASAVFLVLAGLCQGREVLISRGELVEIGGGFRIPDVLRQSGARLVEVGTTNRTHPRDFADALGPETAALMRVHSSNFRQIGFVTAPTLDEMVAIARERRREDAFPIVIDDLGSGTLLDTTAYGLAWEPTVPASVAAGADVITFSGDKLLGGPQAGLIVGRARYLEILRRHPLARALRVDKMTLAALDATLRAYQRDAATEEIPVWQMIGAAEAELRRRVEGWRSHLADHGIEATILPGESTVGGGSLPGETLPTALLAVDVEQPDAVATRLRGWDPPLIGRIQQDRMLFDPRTVLPGEEEMLLAALVGVLASGEPGQ